METVAPHADKKEVERQSDPEEAPLAVSDAIAEAKPADDKRAGDAAPAPTPPMGDSAGVLGSLRQDQVQLDDLSLGVEGLVGAKGTATGAGGLGIRGEGLGGGGAAASYGAKAKQEFGRVAASP